MAKKTTLEQFQLFDPELTKKQLAGIVGGYRGLSPKRAHFAHLAAIAEVFAFTYPDAQPTYDFIKRYLIRQSRRTQEGDSKLILRAVQLLGVATVTDVAEKTHLSPNTVQSHLTQLVKTKDLVKTKSPTEKGRGGNKRGFLYCVPDEA